MRYTIAISPSSVQRSTWLRSWRPVSQYNALPHDNMLSVERVPSGWMVPSAVLAKPWPTAPTPPVDPLQAVIASNDNPTETTATRRIPTDQYSHRIGRRCPRITTGPDDFSGVSGYRQISGSRSIERSPLLQPSRPQNVTVMLFAQLSLSLDRYRNVTFWRDPSSRACVGSTESRIPDERLPWRTTCKRSASSSLH
jgi:hypothetical protein